MPTIPEPTAHDIDLASGIRQRYYRWGRDGEGKPPLTLHHATGFCAMVWRPLAEALAASYDVYAMDRRGHGLTDKPPVDAAGRTYAFEAFTADTVAWFDALGLRDAYAVGHSGGGTEVLMTAAERPAAIARILVVEPIIIVKATRQEPPPGEPRPPSLAEISRNRRPTFPSRQEALDRWGSRPPLGDWRRDVLENYVNYGLGDGDDGNVHLLCPPEAEAAMFENAGTYDPRPALSRVQAPIQILVGAKSGGGFEAMSREVLKHAPHARLEVIPDGTHFLPMVLPDLVVEKIRAFAADAVLQP